MSETYGTKKMPLFDEIARNSDPVSSHKRADKLDRSIKLTKQMFMVLEMIRDYEGLTAKELGDKMVEWYDYGYYELPHKVMSRLEQAGWVRREIPPNKTAYKCYITEDGKKVLRKYENDIHFND